MVQSNKINELEMKVERSENRRNDIAEMLTQTNLKIQHLEEDKKELQRS